MKNKAIEIIKNGMFNIETTGKKGGFFDLPAEYKKCTSPEHEPPTHIHIPHGKGYKHICPVCGKETIIIPGEVSL